MYNQIPRRRFKFFILWSKYLIYAYFLIDSTFSFVSLDYSGIFVCHSKLYYFECNAMFKCFFRYLIIKYTCLSVIKVYFLCSSRIMLSSLCYYERTLKHGIFSFRGRKYWGRRTKGGLNGHTTTEKNDSSSLNKNK